MADTTLTPTMTVGAVAAQYPVTMRMFGALGIDYCCGGQQTLDDAAQTAQMSVESLLTVLRTIIAEAGQALPSEREWHTAPLGDLMDHILKVHHTFLHEELSRIAQLFAMMKDELGTEPHARLSSLSTTYTALRTEVEAHIVDEEEQTFPMIRRLLAGGQNAQIPQALSQLEHQHHSVLDTLTQLRTLTHDYQASIDGCTVSCELYQALQALEHILRRHIHLENNILFPRTRALLTPDT